jgi:hypothetical protein
MKRQMTSLAAFAAALAGACTDAGGKATASLVGTWKGAITCYAIESPLEVTITAAAPQQASVTMGNEASLTWDASVAFDEASRAVAITSTIPTGDAKLIAGTLSSDGGAISGAMDKQLCSAFSLARQP